MSKVNLLLVDDEPHVIEVWKIHFSEDRFNIYEAKTGEEALRLVDHIRNEEQLQFLIVLLDVRMPGLNGLEVMEKIKKKVPFAKVYIITGNVENEHLPSTAYLTGKLSGDGFYEKSKFDFGLFKKQIDDFIRNEKLKMRKIRYIQRELENLGQKADLELPYKI